MLVVSECACGYKAFPPKEICKNCGRRTNIKNRSYLSHYNRPVLLAYTHRMSDFEDIINAIIEIDGVKFPTRITDARREDIIPGMELEPTFRRLNSTQEGLINYGTIFRPRRYPPPERIARKGIISEKTGITGYGVHIPYYRVSMASIDKEYRIPEGSSEASSGFIEKTVPNFDQDALTMGVDAARLGLAMAGITGEEIGAIYFGVVNKPYRMKPSAITLGEATDSTPNVKAYDIECSSRGATSAFPDACSIVDNTPIGIRNSLVVGSDIAHVAEGDALDVGASSAAAAFVFGKEDVVATLEGFESFSSDTPDVWWNDDSEYPVASGRFQGEPAYFRHMANATKILLLKMNLKTEDIDHFVIHHPSWPFVKKIASMIGIPPQKMSFLDTIKNIGNPNTASTLISLASVPDIAKPGERILTVNYGSGAGADAFVLKTTDLLPEKRKGTIPVRTQLEMKRMISYYTYRKRN